jgi:ABC-type multidrug transport system fused ATPase/permease subunit
MCEVALTMKGCEKLHQRLLERVMLAKMAWFDSTPVGRIVNRFSQDVSIVDKYVLEAMMNFVGLLLRTGKFPCLKVIYY